MSAKHAGTGFQPPLHAIYNSHDVRLQDLSALPIFFTDWKQQTQHGKEFLSSKLWFDMQSMVLGFISLLRAKLARFPGSIIKPAIMNHDLVENHFSQLRGANGQNDNPNYRPIHEPRIPSFSGRQH